MIKCIGFKYISYNLRTSFLSVFGRLYCIWYCFTQHWYRLGFQCHSFTTIGGRGPDCIQVPRSIMDRYVQSVKKIYIYLFFKYMFFADISGNTWAIKKISTSICIFVWRAFRWTKKFWNPVTKSADICKNAVLPEKSKLYEKTAILKKSKTFFMDLMFRNWTYIQTSLLLKNHHATSSSQARCVCRIFVNQISISCHNNNEQIRYLFCQ